MNARRSYRSPRSAPTPSLVCSECGGMVADLPAHEAWHDALTGLGMLTGDQLARLETLEALEGAAHVARAAS